MIIAYTTVKHSKQHMSMSVAHSAYGVRYEEFSRLKFNSPALDDASTAESAAGRGERQNRSSRDLPDSLGSHRQGDL